MAFINGILFVCSFFGIAYIIFSKEGIDCVSRFHDVVGCLRVNTRIHWIVDKVALKLSNEATQVHTCTSIHTFTQVPHKYICFLRCGSIDRPWANAATAKEVVIFSAESLLAIAPAHVH